MLVFNLLLLDRRFFQAMAAAQLGVYAISLGGACVHGRSLPCKLVRLLTMFVGMNLCCWLAFGVG